MGDSEKINAVVDNVNTNTRDELTFIELLAEHVFDPSSITEDVNILELSELSEEPSLVHNNSLMDEEEEKIEPIVEPVRIEEEKIEPIVEPVRVEEEKIEPIVEPVRVEEEKIEPIVEPVRVEEEKIEPIVEPVRVEEEKIEHVNKAVKVLEDINLQEIPIAEEPKGVFNKLTSSLFSICNWFVKK